MFMYDTCKLKLNLLCSIEFGLSAVDSASINATISVDHILLNQSRMELGHYE